MKKWVCIVAGIFFILASQWVFGQAPKPPQKTPELLSQGKKLYEQNCALCHGATGDGKGPAGVALKPPPRTFNIPFNQWTYSKGNLNKVFDIITKGIPNTAMVKWSQLSEQERWALVYTVVEFAKPKAPPKKK
ncbi:MAG: c-type cytochrome [Thermodesulfobacteriota bacterium]